MSLLEARVGIERFLLCLRVIDGRFSRLIKLSVSLLGLSKLISVTEDFTEGRRAFTLGLIRLDTPPFDQRLLNICMVYVRRRHCAAIAHDPLCIARLEGISRPRWRVAWQPGVVRGGQLPGAFRRRRTRRTKTR